ncbi:DUF6327 family protein [Aquimarina litoralis]|uniref:Glutaminyl-tRNA synthetase n=1 Tax=Aquimarina litoralis TaxID=584605 RepID=A0ABP3TQG4_9FLAO|nr:DUF6327 family protein [uncultured Aquimarina sp.]
MRKEYTSFSEIQKDLKVLNLQRQICIEEMKVTKDQLKQDLLPNQWVSTILSAVKKYGILYLIRKIFK